MKDVKLGIITLFLILIVFIGAANNIAMDDRDIENCLVEKLHFENLYCQEMVLMLPGQLDHMRM